MISLFIHLPVCVEQSSAWLLSTFSWLLWAHSPGWRCQMLLEEQEAWQLVCGTGVLCWHGACSYVSWLKPYSGSCDGHPASTAFMLVLGDAQLHRLTFSEGAKWNWRYTTAVFFPCKWGRETAKLVVKDKYTYNLCRYEFLSKRFICGCKGENFSIRHCWFALDERASKLQIQIQLLHICELVFLSSWLFSLSLFVCFCCYLKTGSSSWPASVILKLIGFFFSIKYHHQLHFSGAHGFSGVVTVVLNLLEAGDLLPVDKERLLQGVCQQQDQALHLGSRTKRLCPRLFL